MRQFVIALYIRLSLEDFKTESMSIGNQRLYLLEHAMSLPKYDEAEILEFIDNGHSGANFERPAVQELLDLVREGKVDCIIVKDFSRFGRNSIETGYFIERVFPIFHTRFISVADDFDTADYKGDTGGLNVAFKYLVSECYSRDMSMKTKTAKYIKFQRGEYQSKLCPYGYRKGSDGCMEPDPETAPVVHQIFSLAADGMSAAAITRELYRKGIPTPGEYKAHQGIAAHDVTRTNGAWPSSTVLRILEDERYIGTYVIGKRAVTEIGGTRSRVKDKSEWIRIPDHHTAIVDKAVFGKVQATSHRFSLPEKKRHAYPLRGKVVCGLCGHALSRTNNAVYVCRHSQVDPDSPCRDQHIRAGELEASVYEVVSKQIQALMGMDTSETDKKMGAQFAQQTRLEEQVAEIHDGKQQLFEQLVRGEIDEDAFRERNAGHDKELLAIKNTHATVSAQAKDAQKQYEEKVKRQAAAREISGETELSQSLADAMIDKVKVYPDKRIEISYRFADDFST